MKEKVYVEEIIIVWEIGENFERVVCYLMEDVKVIYEFGKEFFLMEV